MKSSEKAEVPVSGDLYRLLLQIALLGAEVGDAKATVHIAEALQNARPDLPQARAVHAMGLLSLGQRDHAVRELEDALERFPDFQLGKALLGVCMKVSGRSGWQSYLDAVIDDGRDEFAVGMACEVMGRPRAESTVSGVGTGVVSNEPTAPPDFGSGHVVWA